MDDTIRNAIRHVVERCERREPFELDTEDGCRGTCVPRCASLTAQDPRQYAGAAMSLPPASSQVAGPPIELEGDRRVVTVVFADLSGFTALGERLDPEELTVVLRECFGELAAEVRSRDGWIEKYIGDALLALFGVPQAHEDDPVRGVSAALAMQARMDALNRRLGPRLGAPLHLHVGVTTGLIVVAPRTADPVRDTVLGELMLVGDTMNTAARLQQAAGPKQVVVGEATYAVTRGTFAYRAIPPLQLKNKKEPVVAYECLGALPAAQVQRGAAGMRSPLLGRAEQLAALRHGIQRLRQGEGGLVSVVGDAGLGKSRLLAEARPAAEHDGGVRWIEGRALSFGQSISYWPFLEMIRSAAGITEDDGEAAAWTKLERRVEGLFPGETASVLPYLASLLGVDVRGDLAGRVTSLDGEAMGRQIFLTARRFFERLARERPTVLVFEDVHWADRSSADLVEHLLPLVRSAPLLICGVSRPDSGTPAAALRDGARRDYADVYTELTLQPLTSEESVELIRRLLAADELPPDVRKLVLDRADGNPFFVEEVLRALVDLKALVRDDDTGRWELTAGSEDLRIPDTLRGVIAARIDRLDSQVKDVLRVAAVIGRTFFYRVLRAVSESGATLDESLVSLRQLELIRERRQAPELEYIFKHALTQEAAYENILLRQRRELHSQVAAAIAELFADRLEEFYGLLAYHYARAEEWEQAQRYLFLAGDRAGAIAADSEALEHYQQALAAYQRAFGDRWDPVQRAALQRKMGEALFRRGEHVRAADYLRRALEYLGHPYPATRRGVRLAIAQQLMRQVAHRLTPALAAGRRRGPPVPEVEERIQCLVSLGWMDYFVDTERLVLDVLLGLNLIERHASTSVLPRAYIGLGLICDSIPLPRLAALYHRRAVATADAAKDKATIGHAYLGQGIHQQQVVGDLEGAIGLLRNASHASWDAGRLREWGASVVMVAWTLLQQGALADSATESETMVRVGEDSGDKQVRAWGEWGLGRAYRRLGRLDEAISHLGRAIALSEEIPDNLILVGAKGELGTCLLHQGKRQDALAVLEESAKLIEERRVTSWYCTPPLLGMAEIHLAAAEACDPGERPAFLKKAHQALDRAMKQSRLERAARPAVLRLRGTYSWLAGKPDDARRWWHRSLSDAEALGARYEEGLTCLEMGTRLPDRREIERAEALLGPLGVRLPPAHESAARAAQAPASLLSG